VKRRAGRGEYAPFSPHCIQRAPYRQRDQRVDCRRGPLGTQGVCWSRGAYRVQGGKGGSVEAGPRGAGNTARRGWHIPPSRSARRAAYGLAGNLFLNFINKRQVRTKETHGVIVL
jgi:hypothetical protein